VKIGPGEAWFEGMTWKKDSDEQITVFLAIGEKDGKVREVKFLYKRVK
jgi:hypothetical protein